MARIIYDGRDGKEPTDENILWLLEYANYHECELVKVMAFETSIYADFSNGDTIKCTRDGNGRITGYI